MRNIKLILSYDGSDFFGWQTQPDRRTVQETLEKAISDLTKEERVVVHASGRTDSGVHAVAQVVNFHTACGYSTANLLNALNARMPQDIVISEAVEVAADFHANYSAIKKMYRYVIHNGKTPNPFLRKYCYFFRKPLDLQQMQRGAEVLIGKHDFACFETEWPNRASSIRTINLLRINRVGDWIWIDVEADGFLYNMVRAITGTLIQVGRGYWEPTEVERILASKDRTQAGPNAPASGLFLMKVMYD